MTPRKAVANLVPFPADWSVSETVLIIDPVSSKIAYSSFDRNGALRILKNGSPGQGQEIARLEWQKSKEASIFVFPLDLYQQTVSGPLNKVFRKSFMSECVATPLSDHQT